MEKALKFYPRINNVDSRTDENSWKKALDFYDAGKHRETINALMKYLGAAAAFPFSGDVDESMPHGSIMVNFRITGDKYEITAPFLKLPETPAKIAVMRQAIELNFSHLILAKIILKDDRMVFYYTDTVRNVNPYKLFYLLEEICYCADYYDDYFIDKFGAARLIEPELTYFTPSQKEAAYAAYTQITGQALKYTDFYEAKRNFARMCDAMMLYLMQIDYVIAPQGELGRLVSEAYTSARTGAAEEAAFKTRDLVKSLSAYERAKFDKCMFFPKFLVPFKKFATLPYTQEFFARAYELSRGDIGAGDFTMAGIELTNAFYMLFWSNTLPRDISSIMEGALKSSSEKPWNQAANTLFTAMQKIMAIKIQ